MVNKAIKLKCNTCRGQDFGRVDSDGAPAIFGIAVHTDASDPAKFLHTLWVCHKCGELRLFAAAAAPPEPPAQNA